MRIGYGRSGNLLFHKDRFHNYIGPETKEWDGSTPSPANSIYDPYYTTNDIKYVTVDGNGNMLTNVQSMPGVLSHVCQPVLYGNEDENRLFCTLGRWSNP